MRVLKIARSKVKRAIAPRLQGTFAQRAGHPAFNRRDEGSNPSRPTPATAGSWRSGSAPGSYPVRRGFDPSGSTQSAFDSGPFNGRTLASDSSNAGSIPAPETPARLAARVHGHVRPRHGGTAP